MLETLSNYPETRLSMRIIGAIKRQFFHMVTHVFDNSNLSQEIFAIDTWRAVICIFRTWSQAHVYDPSIIWRPSLRAIFCKSHPTCDSRVVRISSYFYQLKIKVILEYGRSFSFIKHFRLIFLGSRNNSSFSRNAISVHKLYFESTLSLLELLFRVQVTST